MSVWREKNDESNVELRASMADVIFKLDCKSLPVDHASALSATLCKKVPWLHDAINAGVHPIHVAGSQNGWQRPESDDQPLLLSKRTRLKLRVNAEHAERLIQTLKNTTHHLDNHSLSILDGRISPLIRTSNLFSRYTVYTTDKSADEDTFIDYVIRDCEKVGFSPNKVLCGRTTSMVIDSLPMSVKSVLIAEIPLEYSIPLQEQGLGDLRLIGCGLLIPHKDTGAVA